MIDRADFALLAGSAYTSTRDAANRIPLPPGWSVVPGSSVLDPASGFEGVAYTNGSEIVISYAGTNFPEGILAKLKEPDFYADIQIGFGRVNEQLLRASELYARVRIDNPSTEITLTGHSLGGGLAALVAVFFNERAVTINPAPFRAAATTATRDRIFQDLLTRGLASPLVSGALSTFQTSGTRLSIEISPSPILWPSFLPVPSFLKTKVVEVPETIRGEEKVTAIATQGEILSGQSVDDARNRLRIFGESIDLLGHGSPTTVGEATLHSVTLLASMLSNDAYRTVTNSLPNLLPFVFDEHLFKKSVAGSAPNFEEHILRHQIGVSSSGIPADRMLDHFTNDLQRVAVLAPGSSNRRADGVVQLAMEYYYNTTGVLNGELLDTIQGGLTFDLSRIGVADLDAIKGYKLTLKDLIAVDLAGTPALNVGFQTLGSRAALKGTQQWSVQLGSNSLRAGGSDKNDFEWGGTSADALSGGIGNDVLAGGGGADDLVGGKGDDFLAGAGGFDTYRYAAGDGKDTVIEDATGAGQVLIGNKQVVGGKLVHSVSTSTTNKWEDIDNGLVYTLQGGNLDLGNGELIVTGDKLGGDGNSITIKGFKNGELGIKLEDKSALDLVQGSLSPAKIAETFSHAVVPMVEHLAEGGAKVFTVARAFLSDLAETVKIKLTGGNFDASDRLALIIGDEVISFSGGEADITIAANASTVSFALVEQGDIDTSGSVDLSATLVDGNGNVVSSNNVTVNVDAVNEPDAPQGSPVTTRDILGDLGPVDTDPTEPGVQGITDDLGNLVSTGNPEPDRADVLSDSAGNDAILAGGGNDVVNASRGGDDFIDAGAGDDTVNAGAGNDLVLGGTGNDQLNGEAGDDRIKGGAGSDVIRGDVFGQAGGNDVLEGGADDDIIYGNAGDDRIYGGDYASIEDGIAQGNGPAVSGRGEFLEGLDGNDTIIGSGTADFLSGGDGDDVLVGGAGDDVFYGDSTYDVAGSAWSITRTVNNHTYTATLNQGIFVGEGTGDDRILGGAGDDWAFAGAGDDFVTGDAGADVVFGEAGNDTILGGDGNDVISGDSSVTSLAESLHGDDFLDGGAGDDQIFGEGGNDTLFGGDGNDTLIGDGSDIVNGGDDYLSGEAGNDQLFGGLGSDTLLGGDGDDTLVGDNGGTDASGSDDFLDGGAGDDFLTGQGGDDTLIGGDGNDTLQGDDGADSLDGGNGNDTLLGGAGEDTISGGAGDDTIVGDNGGTDDSGDADFIDGGAGDDTIFGQGGDDTLLGADGEDTIDGGMGDDVIDGGAGNDTQLTGGEGDDSVDGGEGDDLIFGGLGEDTLSGGDGNDTILGDNGGGDLDSGDADFIDGGAGDDQLAGQGGDDTIVGDDGNDFLEGDGGNDTLDGGDGNDNLNGGSGDDALEGGAGEDSLFGDTGDDTMSGGDGLDIYHYNFVDGGVDHIDDSGSNTLFLHGINPIFLQLGLGSLALSDPNHPGNVIHLDNFDPDHVEAGAGVDTFVFDDGTVLSYEDLIARGFNINGTPDADVLEGTSAADTINAYESDDVVIAKAGDDMVDLGSGDDIADAGDGNDTVTAGDGADVVYGGAGDDFVAGDDGDDQLFGEDGSDTLEGGEGLDVLDGGAGDDGLSGGGGDDQLVGGDGDDDLSGGDGADLLDGGAGNDYLDGGEGADVLAGGIGDDTYFVGDSLDTIFENADEGNDTVVATFDYALGAGLENLELAGGSAATVGTGNAGDNVILGNENDNALFGLEGDDDLEGGEGDDYLDGGPGADQMFGGLGNDTYVVDSEDDLVSEEPDFYHREVEFDAGGNIVGYGFLESSGGYDTVEASVSYALDQFTEALVLTGADAIDGTGNAEANYLEGNDSANALYGYRLNGEADEYPSFSPFLNQFNVRRNAAEEMVADKANAAIFRAEFAWFSPQTVDLAPGAGDELYGMGGDDRLYGSLDDDALFGGDGDDLLYGFAGSDYMAGGAGDDTYVVSGGYDFTFGYAGGDQVSYSDRFDHWDTLVEEAGEGIDTVYSEVDFVLGDNFENLTLLADTRAFDPDAPVSASLERGGRVPATFGEGNDLDNVLTANDFGNTLYGDGGDDTLIGGAGNDYLVGGEGTDLLRGGRGDDVYYVADTGDLVVEAAGEGIDEVDSEISYTLTDNVENLWLYGIYGDEPLTGTGNALDNLIVGNDGDNVLSGLAGNDILDGGLGDDLMDGGAGDDTYYVDSEFDVAAEGLDQGHDTVYANISYVLGDNLEDLILTGEDGGSGEGNALDNLVVGDGSDNVLEGYEGSDVIQGNGGNDEIYGDEGDDHLYGGSGADYLEGGDGNDVLDGGADGDTLYGNAGDDAYYVDSYGDTVVEFADEGIDTVYEDLTFYDIGENVENATVIGEYQDIDQFAFWVVNGNDLDNRIIGNDGGNELGGYGGDDTLDGRAGGDTLFGDEGDDRLFGGLDALRMDTEFDFIFFPNSEEGKQVFTTRSALAPNADNLFGGSGDDALDGGSGDDQLWGEDGNDFLYGGDDGLTADSADGGEGGGGTDSTDDGRVFLTNDDYLDGGAGDDILDGGSGDDEIYGGDGNDVLFGGADGPLNRSNRDYLDGGAGIDAMLGGTDDDTYVVDGTYVDAIGSYVDDCGDLITDAPIRVWTTDLVLERADEGYDVVYARADYTLTDNVEELHLLDDPAVRLGRGNGGDNVLYGNFYDNRLEGAGGNDVLYGGFGDDVLDGGGGDDVLYGEYGDNTYNLGAGYGQDVVVSYGGGFDTVHIVGDIAAGDVTLTRQGDDVVIGLNGSSDRMVLSNWILSGDHVQEIDFCDDAPWDEATIADLANSRVDVVQAAGDFDAVEEDGALVASGNVLGNDSDADANAILSVANPATYAGAYGTLVLAADGSYTYTLDNEATQSLAEGETAYDSFGYTAQDDFGAFAAADLTIQVTGRNDAPAFGAASGGAVVEDQPAVDSFLADSILDNGDFENRLNGWNVDGNTEFTGYTFDSFEGSRAGMFGATGEPTLLSQDVATEDGAVYELDFFLRGGAQSDAEFSVRWNGATLAALSNTRFDDYTEFHFDVTGIDGDSHLEFSFRNDPNVWYLDAVTLREQVTEEFVPGDQYTAGDLSFTDVDAADVHDLQVADRGADYLGFFDAWIDTDSSGGNTGTVGWEFDVDNSAIQYLAEGQTIEQTYDLTLDDGHGGTATQSVTVTLTGVNDAPETFDSYADVQEDDTLVAEDNVLYDVFDADQTDVLSVTNAGTYAGLYGTLVLSADGRYAYTLDNGAAAVQALGEGESFEEAFAYTVTDGIASTGATLFVEVAGRNDAPVAADDAAGLHEDGPFVATGNVLANDSDIDAHDVLRVASAGSYLGNYGTLDLAEDGSYAYTLNGAGLESLSEGDVVQDAFAYQASDGLEIAGATLTVTIGGDNDAPVAEDISATVGEDGPAVTLVPVFSDVDAGDSHSVAVGAFGNAGFELGSFAGWTLSDESLGAVVSGGAPLGERYALLSAGAGEGSYTTLTRAFTLSSGEMLSGLAEFLAGDALPYDDDGYVAAREIGGATTLLFSASVTSVGDYGDSGWVPFEFVAPQAGVYVLEAGVRNAQDNSADSELRLDGVEQLRPVAGVTLNGDGSFDYDPGDRYQWLAEGEFATDTLSYTVTDDHGAQSVATATVRIDGANDAPEISLAQVSATVTEDNGQPDVAPLEAAGAISFTDIDLSDAHLVQVGTLDSGYIGEFTAVLVADSTDGGAGEVQWTFAVGNGELDALGEGETRDQSYEVLIDDGHGGLAERIVTVTLVGVNDVPVAADDAASVQEDGAPVASGNVLANDADADATSILRVANPGIFAGAYGSLTLGADGSFTYALDSGAVQFLAAGEQLQESFAYGATDGLATTGAILTVTIAGQNDAPVAVVDFAGVQEDGVLAAAGNLLANDSDIDASDVLAVANPGLYAGAYGVFTLDADGGYRYVLNNALQPVQALGAGQHLSDSIQYTVTDGAAGATALLVVDIAGSNDAPVATGDLASVQEEGPLTAAGNVLANDSDIDSTDTLSVSNPGSYAGSYGTLTLSADGSYSYALDNALAQSLSAGQQVQDQFSYLATDGVASAGASLTVTIGGANDAPSTAGDAAGVQEDAVLVATGNLLANDSDVDAGTLLQVAGPGTFLGNYGTLTVAADGAYVYSLANGGAAVQGLRGGQRVTDTFAYAASDGIASTAGSLTIAVDGTNDNPLAVDDAGAAQEDGPAVMLLAGALLANDTDADIGDTKSVVAVTGSAAGALVTLVGSNAVYDPGGLFQTLKAGATASDTFTYTVADGAGATSTATVLMTITGVNDAPILVAPIADQNASAGTAFSFSFGAGTFADIDAGDSLAYTASLADGSALPAWLAFNSATRTFSGTPPGNSGGGGTGGAGGTGSDCGCGTDGGGSGAPETLALRVIATDSAGATAQDDFVLNIAGGSGSGSGIVPIVGTDHDDIINGTNGNDVIDGRMGYDRMSGGAGDDVYYVDQTGSKVDLVTEGAVAGYDTVYSSANYTLTANIEELHLVGGDDLTAHGNSLANILVGNNGDNKLYGEAGNDLLLDDAGDDLLDGGAGDDVMDGGAGDDTLLGGAGNDLYVHAAGGDNDVVQDTGGTDAVRFGAGIAAADVTVRRSNNDLVLRLSGGNGSVTVKDWFASSAKRVEQVQFADGSSWNEAAIRARVSTGGSGGSDGHDGGHHDGDGGGDNHSNDCGSGGGQDDGHGDHEHDHGGDDHDRDGGSDATRDAIGSRLKRNPNYDFTALAMYLQRNGGGGYGAMTPQQIAQRWLQVQNCVGSLGQGEHHDGDGGHEGGHHEGGGCDSDDGRSGGGWGYSGSTGRSNGCGGMDIFSGLGEGFRRL